MTKETKQNFHKPVLLNEVLENLKIEEGNKYIDATLGDGGHTIEILKRGGIVLGIDYDNDALKRATTRISDLNLLQNFHGALGNFRNIDEIAKEKGFLEADGILMDLGYSTYQLDEAIDGLSFLRDEPLDMRIDKSLGVTAADLVNTLSAKQLAHVFRTYGEENLSKRFSEAIVEARDLKKIQTTNDLVKIIKDVAPLGYEKGRLHPATRVFQALRIVVNDELDNLSASLPKAASLLKLPGGRLAVISFHSLEDRVVKQFGKDHMRPLEAQNGFLEAVNKKPITPLEVESKDNPRARSAKLRVFEYVK